MERSDSRAIRHTTASAVERESEPNVTGFTTGLIPGFITTAVVIIFSTAILFRSLLHSTFPLLWGDDFDPRLIAWAAEWGFQKIFVRHELRGIFNANIFFPHPYTLAYSDSLLSIQVFYAPLRIIGLSTWHSLYGSLALSTISGAALTAVAANRLWRLSNLELAILVFCSHFSLPFITTLNHYQLFGFQFAPALIIFTLSFIHHPSSLNLLASCLLFAFGTGFAMYLAPMFVAVVFFLSAIVYATSPDARNNLRESLKLRKTLLVCAIVIALLVAVQLRPYFIIQKEFPSQSLTETWSYSARLTSLFQLKSMHSLWYGEGTYRENGDWERAIFPGYLLLACLIFAGGKAITAVVRVVRFSEQSKGVWLLSSDGLPALATLLFAICWILSLGPYYDSAGLIRLPYYYLTKFLPGLVSLRAPGRFGMLMGLPLGLAAVATVRIIQQAVFSSKVAPAILLGAMVAESWPIFLTHALPFADLEQLQQELRSHLPPKSVLVQLPTASGDHYSTLKMIMAQMNGANVHGGTLVVGYAAKSTRESDEIVALDGLVQRGGAAPEQLINFLKTIPVNFVVVDRRTYASSSLAGLEQALMHHSTQKIELLNGSAALYALAAS